MDEWKHELMNFTSNQKKHVRGLSCFSRVRIFATLWTIACQAPLLSPWGSSVHAGFLSQECREVVPCVSVPMATWAHTPYGVALPCGGTSIHSSPRCSRPSEELGTLLRLLLPSVHRILQARILEWVAIPFSRGSSWPRDQTHVSGIVGSLLYCRWILYHWATKDSPSPQRLMQIRLSLQYVPFPTPLPPHPKECPVDILTIQSKSSWAQPWVTLLFLPWFLLVCKTHLFPEQVEPEKPCN